MVRDVLTTVIRGVMKGHFFVAIAFLAVYANAAWHLAVGVVTVASVSIAVMCVMSGNIN